MLSAKLFLFLSLPLPLLFCCIDVNGDRQEEKRRKLSLLLFSFPSPHMHQFTVPNRRHATIRWCCFSIRKLDILRKKKATLNVYGIPSRAWPRLRRPIFLTSPWPSSLYLDSCFWLFLKKQPGKENFIVKPIFPLNSIFREKSIFQAIV